MQQIGLKYYEDLKERMPRMEVEELLERIKETAPKVFKDLKERITLEACGSFRRGKETCGDIDVMITREKNLPITGLLEKLVIQLEKEGFLKERLGDFKHS
jgi:DNA polymerase lambda